jgi:glycosyltransferase involved in cell wall biosynthesis
MKRPVVSIILPTWNRSRFLAQAFASIRAQTWPEWELVIVDDGSTDDTRATVERLRPEMPRDVHYVYQANRGPAAARDVGLDHAQGELVAFFDSDDVWLPHHLADCVAALEANPEVHWVYGAGRGVQFETGEVLWKNSFYPEGRPRPFLSLHTRRNGPLHILDDRRTVCCHLLHGLYCGFQNSVIRRSLLAHLRIPPFRLGDDRLIQILALKNGYRLSYLDNVHVIYHVHGGNTSATSAVASFARRIDVRQELIRCYEAMPALVSFDRAEMRAWRRVLSREYFWHLGYATLWPAGHHQEALEALRRGLRFWPYDWRYWKTYVVARVRASLSRSSGEATTT